MQLHLRTDAEEQQTLGRLRQLLTPYEWCVDLPRLIRKWDAVQRAADKARPELRPLVARLNQAFERDYLSADNAFASDCDAALLDEHSYDRLKTEFVRNWAKHEIDRDQAAAVSVTRGDVLVTARAGSGKTRTLVTRTLFLLRHCRVSPREILLLAFNRPAAKHIRDEIRKALEGDAPLPHVMSFHALAHAIVHPDERLVFNDPGADSLGRSRETQECIDEFIRRDGRERRLIRNIMLPLFRGDWERIIEGRLHLPMDELLKYRHSLPRETVNGEYVKSYGEKVIANALFEYGVHYQYECSFPWNGVNYRPDFTIQAQSPVQGSQSSDHGGVVIEYFGLKGQSDYDTMSEEKRIFWRRRPEAFLEYTPRDITSRGKDAFVERLLNDLRRVRVPCCRRSEEEIWQLVRKRAVDSFSKAMTNFIGRCRKQNLSVASLQKMVVTHEPMNTAEERFLKAAVPIYSCYGESRGQSRPHHSRHQHRPTRREEARARGRLPRTASSKVGRVSPPATDRHPDVVLPIPEDREPQLPVPNSLEKMARPAAWPRKTDRVARSLVSTANGPTPSVGRGRPGRRGAFSSRPPEKVTAPPPVADKPSRASILRATENR